MQHPLRVWIDNEVTAAYITYRAHEISVRNDDLGDSHWVVIDYDAAGDIIGNEPLSYNDDVLAMARRRRLNKAGDVTPSSFGRARSQAGESPSMPLAK